MIQKRTIKNMDTNNSRYYRWFCAVIASIAGGVADKLIERVLPAITPTPTIPAYNSQAGSRVQANHFLGMMIWSLMEPDILTPTRQLHRFALLKRFTRKEKNALLTWLLSRMTGSWFGIL